MNLLPSFEILKSLPAYGAMYIAITKDGDGFYSEGFVIRFFKSDRTDWIANFQPGNTGFSTVVELANSKLLVIASGTCYIIDPNQQSPISVFGESYEVVLKTQSGVYVLQDRTGLTILDESGDYDHSEPISYDGIKELNLVEDRFVKGVSYYPTEDDDKWIPFTYDIVEKKLIGGSFEGGKLVRKWWKFWWLFI